MSGIDVEISRALDRLFPSNGQPDWQQVIEGAGVSRRRSRRWGLVLAIVVTVLTPLVAVADSNQWWFLRHPTVGTQPTKPPTVVREGVWSGKRWQLVAYPSADGLCFSLTPTDRAADGGAGLGCGPVRDFPGTHGGKMMPITFLASTGGTKAFPAYIIGPVIATAKTVAIHFDNRTITTPTFDAPRALGRVRFYATELPPHIFAATPSSNQRPNDPLRWIAGYTGQGQIVACLNPRTATDGISPTNDCR